MKDERRVLGSRAQRTLALPPLALALSGAALLAGSGGEAYAPPGSTALAAHGPLHPALHAEAAPPGHTGGFGEPTCQVCHSEFELDVAGDLEVTGLPETFEPGRTYPVTLTLRSEGMERAGFQAAVRWSAGPVEGRSAGVLEASGPGTALSWVDPDAPAAVRYVQHAPGATWTDGVEQIAWTFGWTAPDEVRGAAVTLHATANAANGDDSPFGDIVYTASATSRTTPAK